MGKRAPTHRFMPNKFVFPGGGLELCDQRLRVTQELNLHVMTRLRKETSKRFSSNRVRGLALAAIRETYEETGLIIGRKAQGKFVTANKIWKGYFNYGVEPPLDQLDFIARAITPSQRSRRFDTRFFMVYDDFVQTDPEELSQASGELTDLHWMTLPEARNVDLPIITRWVIDMVEERMKIGKQNQMAQPAHFVRFLHGKTIETMV